MKILFVLGSIILLLTSCSEKDSSLPDVKDPIKIKHNYFPLAIGNYWIYQHYTIDASGKEEKLTIIDSVFINRDTIINNKQFFIISGPTVISEEPKYYGIVDILRDSSGYIVSSKGKIKFTENDFLSILDSVTYIIEQDTICTITYKMDNTVDSIEVPAGKYKVLNYKGKLSVPYSIPGVKNPRYLNTYYADNVGKILSTYYYVHHTSTCEKRLIRYKINKSKKIFD